VSFSSASVLQNMLMYLRIEALSIQEHSRILYTEILQLKKHSYVCPLPALSDNLLMAHSAAPMDLSTKDHSTNLSIGIS
jgi:hypothetical protein